MDTAIAVDVMEFELFGEGRLVTDFPVSDSTGAPKVSELVSFRPFELILSLGPDLWRGMSVRLGRLLLLFFVALEAEKTTDRASPGV